MTGHPDQDTAKMSLNKIITLRAKVTANFKRMRGWLIYVHTMT